MDIEAPIFKIFLLRDICLPFKIGWGRGLIILPIVNVFHTSAISLSFCSLFSQLRSKRERDWGHFNDFRHSFLSLIFPLFPSLVDQTVRESASIEESLFIDSLPSTRWVSEAVEINEIEFLSRYRGKKRWDHYINLAVYGQEWGYDVAKKSWTVNKDPLLHSYIGKTGTQRSKINLARFPQVPISLGLSSILRDRPNDGVARLEWVCTLWEKMKERERSHLRSIEWMID